MDPSSTELKSELENFREQWLSEVRSRRTDTAAGPSTTAPAAAAKPAASESALASGSSGPAPTPAGEPYLGGDGTPTAAGGGRGKDRASRPPPTATPRPLPPPVDDDYVQPPTFDEDQPKPSPVRDVEDDDNEKPAEPVSALDHFEAAVMKEGQGSLGESLKLYRKAFRMDNGVDLLYRKKHFGSLAPRPAQPLVTGPGKKPATEPAAASPQSMTDLIASFSGLSIVPVPPEVETAPTPPCPISSVPEELLVHVFRDVALLDVGDFNRLSLVCKRFAYLVATEERIWRRVCLGAEFGFGGMPYRFQREISWAALAADGRPLGGNGGSSQEEEGEEGGLRFISSTNEREEMEWQERLLTTKALLPTLYGSSWRQMFRSRPRVRFNGCYISTVNYMRTGAANANHVTWNSPVHIVTYYRYLRFFRDGTAASLLTTAEPADVVHHLSRDLLGLHRGGGSPHLSSSVVSDTLRGRWRLSSADDHADAPLEEIEGDLYVETEGPNAKYTYRMELSLGSAGKGARNNKLVWKAFYSYNKLTDDWGEFGLKNYKPFFFSRVKSYGAGE